MNYDEIFWKIFLRGVFLGDSSNLVASEGGNVTLHVLAPSKLAGVYFCEQPPDRLIFLSNRWRCYERTLSAANVRQAG